MPTIAHISDLHFGRNDPVATEALAADLSAVMPDVVVNSGDFTQRSRGGQWRQAREFMARLPSPQICVPGNHDIPLFNLLLRFLAPLRNYQSNMTAELFPTVYTPELAIVGVNTARPLIANPMGFWKDGAFSQAQSEEVESRLSKADRSAARVVVAHHPLVYPKVEKPRHHTAWGAGEALASLGRAGVDLVLSGHFHLSYARPSHEEYQELGRSILCIQAGTAISDRRRSTHGNAYNLITVHSGDHVTVQVRECSGSGFAAASSVIWRRQEGVWQAQLA